MLSKILIVEDESIIALDFQISLEQMGFSVKTVPSGKLAIKEINNANYDLIFMDIALDGELNGFETAMIIKRVHPEIRIIFVSGSSNLIENENNIFEPFQFISKPLDLTELEEVINN
ncbi:MAG: response regulator [Methanobacterium sp.]